MRQIGKPSSSTASISPAESKFKVMVELMLPQEVVPAANGARGDCDFVGREAARGADGATLNLRENSIRSIGTYCDSLYSLRSAPFAASSLSGTVPCLSRLVHRKSARRLPGNSRHSQSEPTTTKTAINSTTVNPVTRAFHLLRIRVATKAIFKSSAQTKRKRLVGSRYNTSICIVSN